MDPELSLKVETKEILIEFKMRKIYVLIQRRCWASYGGPFILYFSRLAHFKICPRILMDFDLKDEFIRPTGIRSQTY